MGMKTSAVWADGTFESNTAPLMGPLEDCARRAAELGYDALSLTVNRPASWMPPMSAACWESTA